LFYFWEDLGGIFDGRKKEVGNMQEVKFRKVEDRWRKFERIGVER